MGNYQNYSYETEQVKEITDTFVEGIKEISDKVDGIIDVKEQIEQSASEANDSSLLAQSYAVGTNNEVRENDATDNAKVYYEYAQNLVNESQALLKKAQVLIDTAISGCLKPGGTITFEELPEEPTVGMMYNISNDFDTDERFEDGAGKHHTAGSNVYYTTEGKWDVLVGIQVTSVNGRIGDVVLDKSDVGLGKVDNTSDTEKKVLSANYLCRHESVRPDTPNFTPKDSSEYGGVRKDVATSSMDNSGVKPYADGHLLTMFWDNGLHYDTQLWFKNSSPGHTYPIAQMRCNTAGSWSDWYNFVCSDPNGDVANIRQLKAGCFTYRNLQSIIIDTTNGWYRVYTVAGYDTVLFNVFRGFNYGTNECYMIAICIKYRDVEFTQLSGIHDANVLNHKIDKLRVGRDDSANYYYIDIHVSENANNTYYVNAIGSGATQTPVLVDDTPAGILCGEFNTGMGLKCSSDVVATDTDGSTVSLLELAKKMNL